MLAWVVEGDSLASFSEPSKAFPLNLPLGDLANSTCSRLEMELKKKLKLLNFWSQFFSNTKMQQVNVISFPLLIPLFF